MKDKFIDEATEKMEVAVENLSKSLQTLRAGRANPHVLDRVFIDYYGTPTPLQQVANITAPDARLITISPFDPSQIKQIEKAILTADLGFNPSSDGKIIRLAVPQLTEERRKELVKQAHKYGEEAKVVIRNIRRKAISDLKQEQKDSELTEDDLKDAQKEVQDLTDDNIKKIDDIIKNKETEIMEV